MPVHSRRLNRCRAQWRRWAEARLFPRVRYLNAEELLKQHIDQLRGFNEALLRINHQQASIVATARGVSEGRFTLDDLHAAFDRFDAAARSDEYWQ